MHQAFSATQWEHGTWDGGAGVCADLLEGWGLLCRENANKRTQNRRWMTPVHLKGTALPVWDIQLHTRPLNVKSSS